MTARRPCAAARLAVPALALALAGCVSFNAPKVAVEERSTVATGSGLRIQELFVGDGEPIETGDTVTFDSTMWLADGARVDSTLDRGTPLVAKVGEAPLAGLDEGLVGMRPGGRRRLELTPDLAYGAQGVPGLVPPDTALVLEVHVLEVERAD